MPHDLMTRDEFVEFVRTAGMGVVATIDATGNPEAALVEVAVTDAAEIVFDTKATARKVANIAGNRRVALVVGWHDGLSIQVEGVADILAGAEREEYGRIYQAQFPAARALLDGFAIVRVTPRWLRYYDARPESFRVVEGCWQ